LERWSIVVDKPYLSFSAAHFLIFPDGTAERLHGHNYRVYVTLDASLSRHGLVVDFKQIKPLVRALCDELDEHWLVPGEHEALSVDEQEDAVVVRYRDRVYRAPREDVIVMPINNVSAENLATWIGRELLGRLRARFADVSVHAFSLAVEETPGQRGVYHYADGP